MRTVRCSGRLGGASAQGSVCLGGVSTRGGVSVQGGLPRGVSAQGGMSAGEVHPPTRPEFLTHACENFTFRNYCWGR